ncbi:MAG: hypothetical protein Q8Q40_03190, partial [Methylococcaceae bacterium]|nr:hypothetical protein [Methylococcaceae bacterium]MDP3902964.1 hypothetical protein [Methylococcaceae bacterium]
EIAENGDFRLKQVLMRGQNTKNSRDSVADLSLSVYFLFIRAVFRGALKKRTQFSAPDYAYPRFWNDSHGPPKKNHNIANVKQ